MSQTTEHMAAPAGRIGWGRGRDLWIKQVADWGDSEGLAVSMGELQCYYRLSPDNPEFDRIADVLRRNARRNVRGPIIKVWIDPVRRLVLDADDATLASPPAS